MNKIIKHSSLCSISISQKILFLFLIFLSSSITRATIINNLEDRDKEFIIATDLLLTIKEKHTNNTIIHETHRHIAHQRAEQAQIQIRNYIDQAKESRVYIDNIIKNMHNKFENKLDELVKDEGSIVGYKRVSSSPSLTTTTSDTSSSQHTGGNKMDTLAEEAEIEIINDLKVDIVKMSSARVPKDLIMNHILAKYPHYSRSKANGIIVDAHIESGHAQPKRDDLGTLVYLQLMYIRVYYTTLYFLHTRTYSYV